MGAGLGVGSEQPSAGAPQIWLLDLSPAAAVTLDEAPLSLGFLTYTVGLGLSPWQGPCEDSQKHSVAHQLLMPGGSFVPKALCNAARLWL